VLALGKGLFTERPIFDSRQRCRPSAKLLCPVVGVGAVIIRSMRHRLGPELNDVDVEARHGAPQVPPACGQHARPHHLSGLEGGHDDVEEAVR
jgi:hypothetical protein